MIVRLICALHIVLAQPVQEGSKNNAYACACDYYTHHTKLLEKFKFGGCYDNSVSGKMLYLCFSTISNTG